MTVELTDDYYKALVKRARSKDSWWTKAFIIIVVSLLLLMVADHFRLIPPALVDKVLGEQQTVYSTPAPELARPLPQPAQRYTPFYAAPTAVPVLSGELPGGQATAEPTSGAFWTPAEETQMAATATAFIVEVPTAPAAFVAYTLEQCRDPEIVAASRLLQAWCPEGE